MHVLAPEQMLRNRQTVLQRLYPEHRLRFAFDRYKRACIVVPPNLPRGGLPVWVSAQIPTMTEAEFREHHGDKLPIYGQQDVMQLLVVGAEWQVCSTQDHRGRPIAQIHGCKCTTVSDWASVSSTCLHDACLDRTLRATDATSSTACPSRPTQPRQQTASCR